MTRRTLLAIASAIAVFPSSHLQAAPFVLNQGVIKKFDPLTHAPGSTNEQQETPCSDETPLGKAKKTSCADPDDKDIRPKAR